MTTSTFSLGKITNSIWTIISTHNGNNGDEAREDQRYYAAAGDDRDEEAEVDDDGILAGDEDMEDGSDEGEGEDLIENMEM